MSSEQQFCLRWHNYQSSLLASLPQLLDGDDLTDITLMAGGCNLKAHRVVLSACSQYFKELFKVLQPLQHPVVVLPGAKFTDLCALVTFMYSGEVNIYQEQLQGLLSMADALQIRGLAEVNMSTDANEIPKKDSGRATAKRARMSTQPSGINPNKCMFEAPRSMPKDTSENHNIKNFTPSNEEMYGSIMKAMETSSRRCDFDTEQHLKSHIRNSGTPDSFGAVAETLRKNVRNQSFKQMGQDLSLSSFNDDKSHTDVSCLPGSLCKENTVQLVQVKTEKEGNSRLLESNISRDLESTLSDDQNQCYGIQDDQSPTSNESAADNTSGGILNTDGGSEKIYQPNQGLNLSALSSSSQYTKQWSTSQLVNTKLFATCFVCGKQLSNQYNLRVHMETHQNVNYACNVCSHVSRSRDALRKHVSYRHPGEAKERIGNLSHLSEGQIGSAAEDTIVHSKTAKVTSNKDNNNNKRSHP